MPYALYDECEAPQFLIGSTDEFKKSVPDRSLRADFSNVYRKGGRKLNRDEVPSELVLSKKRKNMPAGFITINALFIVSEPVVDILNDLDPDIHQFFPIDVFYEDRTRPDGSYFVLNVTYQQDSIVNEQSSVSRFFSLDPLKPSKYFDIHHHKKNVTLQESALSGVNMWREARYPASLFISDAVFDALKAQKLKLLRSYKTKAI